MANSSIETRGYVLSYLARFGFRRLEVDKKVRVISGVKNHA